MYHQHLTQLNTTTQQLRLQTPFRSSDRLVEEREVALYSSMPFEDAFAELQTFYDAYLFNDELLWAIKNTGWFKALNTPFKTARYVSISRVGELMKHRWQNKNLSLDEWVEKYTTEVLPLPSFFRLVATVRAEQGHLLTADPFIKGLADEFGEGSLWLSALWVRLFVESDMGLRAERQARKFLEDRFGSVRISDGGEEARDHLDLLVPARRYGYQVKRKNFLSHPRNNEGFRADQRNNFHSQLQWEERTGGEVFYLLAEDLEEGNFYPIPLRGAMMMAGFKREDFE